MIIGPIYPENTLLSFSLNPNIKLKFESKNFLFFSISNCIISVFPL